MDIKYLENILTKELVIKEDKVRKHILDLPYSIYGFPTGALTIRCNNKTFNRLKKDVGSIIVNQEHNILIEEVNYDKKYAVIKYKLFRQ